MISRHCQIALTLFTTLWSTYVNAQESYPLRAVRVMVHVAPGGGVDIQARLFSQKLSEQFGRAFLVENRPSAGGADAFGHVAKAAPDGYLLLAVNPSFTVPHAFAKNLPDPVKDFAPISLLSRAPFLLVVHPSIPVKTVKEFISLAKSKPGKLNFAGAPSGTATHLAAAWFFSAAKIDVSYVPYKGTGPAQIALVGGETDATMASVVSVRQHINTGRLRAVGVTSAERSKVLPNLPTLAEQGAPGYEYITFFGFVAPASTPAAVLNKLNTELAKIVVLPEIESKFLEEGAVTNRGTPLQFGQFIAAEVGRWNKVVKITGIKAE